jgi:rhomboid family GlyGly-CTERM serine protease
MPWASVCIAAACAALALAPASWVSLLEYDRQAILDGALWPLWTGHLVHFSAQHGAMSTGAFLAAGVVAERLRGTRWMLRALATAAPLVGLGLLVIAPALSTYRGMSAMAWTGAAVVAVTLWRQDPALRPWIGTLAGSAMVKLVLDAGDGTAALAVLPDGVRVEWRAHLLGAVAALALLRSRVPASGPGPRVRG